MTLLSHPDTPSVLLRRPTCSHHITSQHITAHHSTAQHITAQRITSHHSISQQDTAHIMLDHGMSYHTISYHNMPCRAISYDTNTHMRTPSPKHTDARACTDICRHHIRARLVVLTHHSAEDDDHHHSSNHRHSYDRGTPFQTCSCCMNHINVGPDSDLD